MNDEPAREEEEAAEGTALECAIHELARRIGTTRVRVALGVLAAGALGSALVLAYLVGLDTSIVGGSVVGTGGLAAQPFIVSLFIAERVGVAVVRALIPAWMSAIARENGIEREELLPHASPLRAAPRNAAPRRASRASSKRRLKTREE